MTPSEHTGVPPVRAQVRRLVARRAVAFATVAAVSWTVLLAVVSLLDGHPGDRLTADVVRMHHAALGVWLTAPAFLVGACAVTPTGGAAGRAPHPPRRVTLLAVRLLSALVVATTVGLIGSALLAAVLWTGRPGPAGPALDVWVRTVVLAAVPVWAATAVGLSVATIGRRTAVAAAALAAYAGLWELPVLLAGAGPGPPVFSAYALSWLAQPTEFAGSNIGGPVPRARAGLTLAALAGIALTAAAVIEHRRSRAHAR